MTKQELDDKVTAFMKKAKRRQWQHGFTMGYLFDDGTFRLVPTPLVGGSCVVEGKVVKG